jgi:hypothetical protein
MLSYLTGFDGWGEQLRTYEYAVCDMKRNLLRDVAKNGQDKEQKLPNSALNPHKKKKIGHCIQHRNVPTESNEVNNEKQDVAKQRKYGRRWYIKAGMCLSSCHLD